MNFESVITRLSVFSQLDRLLSKSISTQEDVVIYGFWRSGTTFMMEQVARLNASRSYFEPLLLKEPETWPARYRRQNSPELDKFTLPDELLAHPCYYVNAKQNESGIDGFLDDMMRGKVSSKWTRKSRPVAFSLSKKISLKLVRGNLLAGYISKKYGVKSVFVLRHPGGIMASMTRKHRKTMRKGGIETGLISESFIHSLLNQNRLVEDYLSPYIEVIQRFNTNAFNRVILAWAITNYVPLKQMIEGEFNPHFILYENYVLDPGCNLNMAKFMGVSPEEASDRQHFDRDSATVQGDRKSIHPTQRLFGWRQELSQDQIETIYAICSSFGPVIMDQIKAIDKLADVTGSKDSGQ